MESMVVYLGSDHVIKTPDFDFRKNSLRVSTTLEDAKQQAHKKVGIGVVSVYQFNLEHLVSIEDGQRILDGFENVDVLQHTWQDACSLFSGYVTIFIYANISTINSPVMILTVRTSIVQNQYIAKGLRPAAKSASLLI